jgi:membrane protein DedA with SNARE-associated domain
MFSTSYAGILLLMLAENVFPPIPSELIMPLAGFMVAQGKLTFFGTIAAGTAGSVFGALLLYCFGKKLGEERVKRFAERYGCWLTVSGQDIDRASRWFDKHGGTAVLFGRLVPGVRSLVSVPAGIAGMNLPRFLVYTTLGTALWTALLVFLGYLLGSNFKAVEQFLDPASWIVFGAIAILYLVRVIKQKERARLKSNGAVANCSRCV